ncbi:Disease resistance protein (CC-NBS-LRR class) family [Rhynchospora pubera]|uniref:Disease resistance protein (CC-NBS-LRR class) family n=1 Tax=Rhynchospora pubera TaxID=906938 RepID=A0AAV8CKT9_9POAL|nr:Disease resistance protein (CC-NBS-LRR class) family [Rhynchospora pubera]
METTALSLAKTVLGGVLQKASSAAVNEVANMLGVRQDVWYIKGEMEMIQSFLIAAEAQPNENILVRTWVIQVRELAYQIENCLAECVLHLENRGLGYKLQTLGTRRRIASNIRSIREQVYEVSQRNLRYNIIKPMNFSSEVQVTYSDDTYETSMDICVAEEVGYRLPEYDEIEMMMIQEECLKVIWVVGMDGLGKTALAKTVFNRQKVCNNFPCRVWVTLSQISNVNDLLREILKKISKNKEEEVRNKVEELFSCVRSQLELKKYLVVLDDLRTQKDWDIIERVFPNKRGSCVMVTTTSMYVANRCNWERRYIHLPEPLSDESSRNLLLEKIYETNKGLYSKINSRYMDIVNKIIRKCRGVPLAILTIGGLLATKPMNIREWERVVYSCGYFADESESCLYSSYQDLPDHLKQCLLYVCPFPENFEIPRSMLIYQWVAEQHAITKHEIEGQVMKTAEEVANEYFCELINRNLIQPWNVGYDGMVKSCRVHIVMRKFLIKMLVEKEPTFTMNRLEKPVDKIHRLIKTKSNEIGITSYLQNIKAVSIFDARVSSVLLDSSKLKFLRILHFQDMTYLDESELSYNNFKLAITRHLGNFKYLKYISMPRITGEVKLPKSVGNLRHLQTLDMRDVTVQTVPNTIIKLEKLRHLLIGPAAMPKGIGNLKELQVLKHVDIGRSHRRVVGELAQLRQLRKLGVANLGRGHDENFSASISELSSLRSLKIRLAKSEGAAGGFLDSVSSPPEHLRSINLEGWIEKLPVWVSSLYNLAKVTLWETRLDDDAIVLLQELPNLLLLDLCVDSYVRAKLTFRSVKFSKLKQLSVTLLTNLDELIFEEGTSPELQTLEIEDCELKSGISGAEHLPKLKKLKLDYNVYVANLDEVQRQVGEHPNHPALEIVDPEYQKERDDFYRGNTSGGPPVQENTEEIENSSSRCSWCMPHF